MNPGWRYLATSEAVHSILACKLKDRDRLLKLLERLAEDPYIEPEFSLADETGQPISFVTLEKYQIGFWVDHFVKELRIVEINPL